MTTISIPVLLYSAQSRPLSILLLEYSFSGELERGAALGLLITVIICVMIVVGRRFGLLDLSQSEGGRGQPREDAP
jgi:iron(III) transport system permease protein